MFFAFWSFWIDRSLDLFYQYVSIYKNDLYWQIIFKNAAFVPYEPIIQFEAYDLYKDLC
jgi:hypothetical protein